MSAWYRSPLPWLMLASCLVLAWAAAQAWPRRPRAIRPEASLEQKLPFEVEVFAADPSLGPSSAAITIVEFSDFQCPYCAQSAPVVKQAAESGGKVRLVWKDYPGPGHDQALPAAIAAQCAHQQGKFWQYHDALFREQASLSSDTYLRLAGAAGLRVPQFTDCLNGRETRTLIERNVQEGDSVGVDGTPFYIINGQAWSGLLTASDLESIIRQYP